MRVVFFNPSNSSNGKVDAEVKILHVLENVNIYALTVAKTMLINVNVLSITWFNDGRRGRHFAVDGQ